MKKYKLKGWVEFILFLLLAIIFICFFAVIERNVLYMIIDKLIMAVLFYLIANVLIKYSDMED